MADTLKLAFTYLIATIVVVGGFTIIYLTRSEQGVQDIRVLIGGFMGAALTFVFSSETSSRTAHQQAKASQQAAANALLIPGQQQPPNEPV